jgi:hypothetical protein
MYIIAGSKSISKNPEPVPHPPTAVGDHFGGGVAVFGEIHESIRDDGVYPGIFLGLRRMIE